MHYKNKFKHKRYPWLYNAKKKTDAISIAELANSKLSRQSRNKSMWYEYAVGLLLTQFIFQIT